LDPLDFTSYELFKHNALFAGIELNQIETLFSVTKESILEPGKYLIQDGEKALEMYFVLEGELEVIKRDEKHHQDHVIATLKGGDVFGEIALVDRGLRSASVRSLTTVRVRSLIFSDFERLSKQDPELLKIYIQISQNISHRLRHANEKTIEAVQREADQYKTRVFMGTFLVNIITMICLFTFSLQGLKYLLKSVPNTSVIAIPLIVIFAFFSYLLMRKSNLPPVFWGMTCKNWKRSVYEGILYTIPFLGLQITGKLLLLDFDPVYLGHSLFEPYAMITDPAHKNLTYWIILTLSYWLFVPLQEILARGVLQGLLEEFLVGKYRVWTSIFVSNLIFGTVHLWLTGFIAATLVIQGIYLGWLYSRTHNLIGVSIAHMMLGTWGLAVVGFLIF